MKLLESKIVLSLVQYFSIVFLKQSCDFFFKIPHHNKLRYIWKLGCYKYVAGTMRDA